MKSDIKANTVSFATGAHNNISNNSVEKANNDDDGDYEESSLLPK